MVLAAEPEFLYNSPLWVAQAHHWLIMVRLCVKNADLHILEVLE